MLYDALGITGAALSAVAAFAYVTGRFRKHHIYGVMSVGYLLYTLGNVLSQDTVSAGMGAGFTTILGWLWWKGGGGDDTKRRLKSWASRFQGVRRTAPTHS
ncbi:hypothetical protein DMH12_24940 [Streptomyces sp. WAC 04229]|uniref:hypothetical protein n=1 Tax=Streptomyces sp. WAC 04229 TaxID=2203206 RepID=UPI000F738318|nr:hypothetical protein [Streptomyces sp. WAC 04229]RSN50532.1 hypothetical protein DMH12_24940 [Streptomyces sp. WAC 04229]